MSLRKTRTNFDRLEEMSVLTPVFEVTSFVKMNKQVKKNGYI